jgi:replicative DNA helicase
MNITALQNLEAELGVLGALIFDPLFLDDLTELTADHFAEPFHGRIFAEVVGKIRAGGLAEPASLAARFSTDPASRTSDGETRDLARFFDDLMNKSPTQRVALSMAETVMDAARRRQLNELSARMRDDAADPSRDPFDTLTAAEKDLTALVQTAAPDGATLISALDAAGGTLDRLRSDKANGTSRGAMTGLRCFDVRLGGIQPSKLIIAAGRPSMGKTSLARAAGFGCAKLNPDGQVVYFCLEMDRDEMSLRNLSAVSKSIGKGVPYFRMEGENLSDDAIRLLDECRARIPPNFILDDSSSLSIEHVERRSYSLAKRAPIKLIIVDYLQIMEMPRAFNMNRTEAVGEITQRLKRLAKRLGCGVLALSQLSRKVEERDSKRPILSDLRDSGSIEQDANVVLFPFRESYYLERQDAPKGMEARVWEAKLETAKHKMEVICAKQRGGPIGSDFQKYEAAFDYLANEGEDLSPAWDDAALASFV